jgi:very-short-patch-repair endonuclease
LSERRPITIDVTTPRRCCSQPGVRVHDRRIRTLEWERGLPTTTVIDTLLDVAAAEDTGLDQVRYLLSQADYHHLVDLGELNAVGRRGRPGGALLRSALHRHLPQLARTRSPLEIDWLLLCERHDLPLPETNVPLLGFTVDAMWREQRVVVEVDGEDGHAGPARLESDRRRDLRLRSGGFIVLRYTWSQVHDDEDEVAADIRAALLSRTARSA